MKTKLRLLLLILPLAFIAKAQKPENSNARIEALRAQFITEKLDLQPEEAQQFWPIYNQYRNELDKIQGNRLKELSHRRQGDKPIEDMTDSEAEKLILEELNRQRKLLDLREAYYSKFKAVIPIQKVALLYKAEMEFKKKLIHHLSGRHKKH
ncbi:MAG: hypothetical protein RLP14_06260 [Owenweeksia sp.]